MRITAQLIDAITGAHLWADRFDGSLEDVFDLQDQVAISVAGVIEPALQTAETGRSANRPTNDLTAYDLYLRAYAMFFSSQIPEALLAFEEAIERDPGYGPALAWGAICCQRLVAVGHSEDPAGDSRKGTDLARAALRVAADDPGVLANAAVALAYFGEDIGAVIGYADFLSQRFNEAVPKLRLAIQEDPTAPNAYRYLAAPYAFTGRLGEAREVIHQLLAVNPVVVPNVSFRRNPEHRELFLSGLRLAAGEAT